MGEEELIHRGIKFPKSIDDKITEEMNETGLDRTSVVRKIIFEHYRQKEHPELLKERIREILRDDPSLLDEPLRKIAIQRLAEPAFVTKPRK